MADFLARLLNSNSLNTTSILPNNLEKPYTSKNYSIDEQEQIANNKSEDNPRLPDNKSNNQKVINDPVLETLTESGAVIHSNSRNLAKESKNELLKNRTIQPINISEKQHDSTLNSSIKFESSGIQNSPNLLSDKEIVLKHNEESQVSNNIQHTYIKNISNNVENVSILQRNDSIENQKNNNTVFDNSKSRETKLLDTFPIIREEDPVQQSHEVHVNVTIGRLEVHNKHQPDKKMQAPTKVYKPNYKTLTLTNYLKERKKGI